MTGQRDVWVIVLAGGDGRRLGALTANPDGVTTPKQYCSLDGGPSLLQLALYRALDIAPQERVVIVVNDTHRRWWGDEFKGNGRWQVVVQPTNRGTGLGLLLALQVIARSDAAASVVCLPSDHYVENEDVLTRSIWKATALQAFACDKLTLLGMIPNAPDPGFGYLTSTASSGIGMRPVSSFVEKPSREVAARLIVEGSLWNSGIFAGRLQAMLMLYPRHVPGLVHHIKSVVDAWPDLLRPSPALEDLYSRHPPIDFSRDVLQKQPARLQFIAVPPCGWNDVGTPERLATTLWALRSKRERPAALQCRAPVFHLATAFVPAMAANGLRFSAETLQE